MYSEELMLRMYGRTDSSTFSAAFRSSGFSVFGVLAQVDEHGADTSRRRVEHRDAALGELRDHLRIPEHREAIYRRVRQRRVDRFLVVGDARRAPHVVHGVFVARVEDFEALGDVGIEVLEVVELATCRASGRRRP